MLEGSMGGRRGRICQGNAWLIAAALVCETASATPATPIALRGYHNSVAGGRTAEGGMTQPGHVFDHQRPLQYGHVSIRQ